MKDQKKEIVLAVAANRKEVLKKAEEVFCEQLNVERSQLLGSASGLKLMNPFGKGELFFPRFTEDCLPDYTDISKPAGIFNTRFALLFSAVANSDPETGRINNLMSELLSGASGNLCYACCLVVSPNDRVKHVFLDEMGDFVVEEYEPSESSAKQKEIVEGEDSSLRNYAEQLAWSYRLFE